MTIYITKINSKPRADEYSQFGLPTETYLVFYPLVGHIVVEQESRSNSTPYSRFMNLELGLHLPDHPLDSDIVYFVEQNRDDFQFVADNYESFHDGGGVRGRFSNDESRYAWEHICESAQYFGFNPGWQWWNVQDWCDSEIHNVHADMNDEELSNLAAMLEPDKSEHVVLDGDILEYLKMERDILSEENYG